MRLLNHLIEGGSSALFVLGSTGESPGLSGRLRRDVIDRACASVGRSASAAGGDHRYVVHGVAAFGRVRGKSGCFGSGVVAARIISISASQRFSDIWSDWCRCCLCRCFSTTFRG